MNSDIRHEQLNARLILMSKIDLHEEEQAIWIPGPIFIECAPFGNRCFFTPPKFSCSRNNNTLMFRQKECPPLFGADNLHKSQGRSCCCGCTFLKNKRLAFSIILHEMIITFIAVLLIPAGDRIIHCFRRVSPGITF